MNRSRAVPGKRSIAPIAEAPAAFSTFAQKINEIALALETRDDAALSPVAPLLLVKGEAGPSRLALDITALAKLLRLDPEGQAVGGTSGAGSASSGPYSELRVVNGTTSIVLDASGITMTDTAGAGKSMTLLFSALMDGKSVSLRVDDYCDGTTSKSMQHLASAPYV